MMTGKYSNQQQRNGSQCDQDGCNVHGKWDLRDIRDTQKLTTTQLGNKRCDWAPAPWRKHQRERVKNIKIAMPNDKPVPISQETWVKSIKKVIIRTWRRIELASPQYFEVVRIPMIKVLLHSGFPVCKPSVDVSRSNSSNKKAVSQNGR